MSSSEVEVEQNALGSLVGREPAVCFPASQLGTREIQEPRELLKRVRRERR